jgi:septum formation inhibitor-activating ATPase MinD
MSDATKQEMDAEIEHRIREEIERQLDDPATIRHLREAVVVHWQSAISKVLPDNQTRVKDSLTNEDLDRLLQQTIEMVIRHALG